MAIAKCQLGNITVEEFARVMKESGQNPTDAEVQQIIKEVDLGMGEKPVPLLHCFGNFSLDNVPLLLEHSALSNH
jgi:hypothetical protein